MSYFLIEDFKAGLDVRKSVLTAPAGSLTKLVNAAITPGGEIMKRRAFVKVADLKDTFGLAAIGTKVVAFTRNTTPTNPGIHDPVTGEMPNDVVLEYHRLPNTSPTAQLADYDTFDGKLYVTLYDATPSPPQNCESGPTLPPGVAEKTTFGLPDGSYKEWTGTAWKDWEADKRVGNLPARGYNNNTFRVLPEGNVYTVDFSGQWVDWKPRDKGAGVPCGEDGDQIISQSASSTTNPNSIYQSIYGSNWPGSQFWQTGTTYATTPVGQTAPSYYSSGDTFLDTSNGNIYVVRAGKWAAWYADGSGEFLPSPQMEGYTVWNYTEEKAYVTKDRFWKPWAPDQTVSTLPKAYTDGTAFYNTTDGNYYEWKTSDWILWRGQTPKPNMTGLSADRPVTGNKYDVYYATDTQITWLWEGSKWVQWALSPRLVNPHYYYDDREEVRDEYVQNLDLSWEWTMKPNPNKDSYVETEGSGMGLFVRAYKSKMYAVGDKYLRFSAVNEPFLWEPSVDPNDTSRTGAGYINVALQEGGSSQLRGVEIYYDKLALLSEYTTQIWSVVSDPKQNALGQILRATGTKSPWSVQQYGSGDILFLNASGIRSLKARDLSNSAAVSDIGSPIDDYVRDLPDKYAATPAGIGGEPVYPGRLVDPDVVRSNTNRDNFYYNARAILEPVVGRFWLAFPREIMVLSAFPGPNITAWSVYTTPFNVDYIVVAGDRVFIRSGDDLYLFGGVGGRDYDDCGVEVRLPYHDGGKPGHQKLYTAVDVTAQGDWEIACGFDYDNPEAEEPIANVSPTNPDHPISSSSWNKGRYELSAFSSHMSVRLYNNSDGPAVLSNAAIHYSLGTDAD